jgi:hypothetical protein
MLSIVERTLVIVRTEINGLRGNHFASLWIISMRLRRLFMDLAQRPCKSSWDGLGAGIACTCGLRPRSHM